MEGNLLFHIFLLFFGAFFWYAYLWSSAKNKKSKALKARIAICDSKAERALVYADDKYEFSFKEWLKDNEDEMVITGCSCVALLLFDNLAAEWVKKTYNFELGDAVFLLGGIGGDMLYRAIDKMRNG